MPFKPVNPLIPVDPMTDIESGAVKAAFVAAAQLPQVVDSPENREPSAKLAQDRVIALRALKRPINAEGVVLLKNGDLFIFGSPVHPRGFAERIAGIAELVDLQRLNTHLATLLPTGTEPSPDVATVASPAVAAPATVVTTTAVAPAPAVVAPPITLADLQRLFAGLAPAPAPVVIP